MFEWLEGGSTEDSGTLIDESNPVELGDCRIGVSNYPVAVHQRTLNLWYDRGGLSSASPVSGVTITATSDDGDPDHPIMVGTPLNGGVPCIEVRSTGSFNCIADAQSEWTKIAPDTPLPIGDMLSNSMRVIEVRVTVPIDMIPFSEEGFSLNVNWDS